MPAEIMKEEIQSKEYKTPIFQIIIQDESNKVFFSASGGPAPAPTSMGANLSGIGGWE